MLKKSYQSFSPTASIWLVSSINKRSAIIQILQILMKVGYADTGKMLSPATETLQLLKNL